MTEANTAIDNRLDELFGEFLIEGTQLVDRLQGDLLALGAARELLRDDARLNNMFRSVHSLKGLSAMLRLTNMQRLAHHIENVLDAARKDQLPLDQRLLPLLTTAIDRLTAMVSMLHGAGHDRIESIDVENNLRGILSTFARDLNDARLVSIGPLLGSFQGVVADIARRNAKYIRFVVLGEETTLDKHLADELRDPLLHLVCNAADHGIELPRARRAASKPAHGTLTLAALTRDEHLIITIRDDGRGLDLERILATALARGLIGAEDIECLTPRQAWELIWVPGFSTVQQVTETSGRGMGLDIVRAKIAELGGAVAVDSQPGQGTTFTIELPAAPIPRA